MAKNQAFIFDMDGVICDSEPIWDQIDPRFLKEFFGEAIGRQVVKSSWGLDINSIYRLAESLGFKGNKKDYLHRYDQRAKKVYARAKITPGLAELINYLKLKNYQIGLVSSSRLKWIRQLVNRLADKNSFAVVVSLNDMPQLKPKPSPDGYLYALRKLKADPKKSYILEDSPLGIKSAKASGATVICLLEHQLNNFRPKAADIYVKNLQELVKINLCGTK